MIDFSPERRTTAARAVDPRVGSPARSLPYIHDNDRKHHFDRERILGGMAKLGLLGISVPQQYGGAGMDLHLRSALASEELEYASTRRCA